MEVLPQLMAHSKKNGAQQLRQLGLAITLRFIASRLRRAFGGGMMKTSRWVALAIVVVMYAADLYAGSGMQKVEYLSDSIAEKEGKYIRLLGGSSWLLSSPTLALVTDDVLIVFQEVELKDKKKVQIAVAYIEGDEVVAKHVDGQYVTQTGYLTTVVEALGDGAVLKLADGTLLSIPQYDRYDTGWWLPPYKALLTGNKMYLWNLKKGKRVWVNPR